MHFMYTGYHHLSTPTSLLKLGQGLGIVIRRLWMEREKSQFGHALLGPPAFELSWIHPWTSTNYQFLGAKER